MNTSKILYIVELVIGLTDRVVRTYQWTNSKLRGLNKWEFANQIGTVAINDMANKTPSLLVAHPGGRSTLTLLIRNLNNVAAVFLLLIGTFIRLKCKPLDNVGEQTKEEHGCIFNSIELISELTRSNIEFCFKGIII